MLPFLIIFAIFGSISCNLSCKDEKGQDVDWFYLYKLPKHHTAHPPAEEEANNTGLRFLYLTSDNVDDWQLSSVGINENDSMPALTLDPIFRNETVLLVAYNDEFPNGTVVSTGGHTKGVFATDGITGIWVIHSVPKFPKISTYDYPPTGERYGQSFLCLTFNFNEMTKVADHLLYNEPNIYYSHIPLPLSGKFPSLENAIARNWLKKAPYQNLVDLVTNGDNSFRAFAKGSKYDKELYEDWVAPELDVNLLVETWRNGRGNLESNCSKSDKVYNINEIEHKGLGLTFKTTSDHSKWAVSQESGFKLWRWRLFGADWICVGDINRQMDQKHRGGGTVCQKNSKIAQLYRKLIHSFDKCANGK